MTAGQVLEYGALVSRRDELRQLQENEEVTAELNLSRGEDERTWIE